jgi:monoamine oxidase
MSESDGGEGAGRGAWTRRRFLGMVGRAGGAAAVYETMTAMGLINVPAAWAGPLQLPEGSGAGKSVLVLGAGIGGLAAAYELSRAGYRCQILEAQERAGGRSLTARRGTVITEDGDHGTTRQTCKFDDGLYLNMGPGRLPYHHRRVLHYCQELGVPLEVYVMETTANLYQTDRAFDGRPQVNRRLANDARGYIAELLAKAVCKGALDQSLNEEDRHKLMSLLATFGDLDGEACEAYDKAATAYAGSTRSGCARPLTVYQPCEPEAKLGLSDLLRSDFWLHRFYQPVDFEWQPTLFQPVGGMDQIVEGFKRRIGNLVQYRTEILEIHLRADGVEVVCRDRETREKRALRADHCLSSIPLPLLKQLPANFSDGFKKALANTRSSPTCKVGWQANRRFWETEREIYGGISWTDDPITQMWYPSYDYFSAKGTLTGAYNYDAHAERLGRMGLEERLATARQGAVKLHPEFADDRVVPQSLGLSIAWQNVPFQRGGWAAWDDQSPADRDAYARLLEPDGRFQVIGDQVSSLPGWQEGAMMSAEHAIGRIAGLLRLEKQTVAHAPSSRRVAQGR